MLTIVGEKWRKERCYDGNWRSLFFSFIFFSFLYSFLFSDKRIYVFIYISLSLTLFISIPYLSVKLYSNRNENCSFSFYASDIFIPLSTLGSNIII